MTPKQFNPSWFASCLAANNESTTVSARRLSVADWQCRLSRNQLRRAMNVSVCCSSRDCGAEHDNALGGSILKAERSVHKSTSSIFSCWRLKGIDVSDVQAGRLGGQWGSGANLRGASSPACTQSADVHTRLRVATSAGKPHGSLSYCSCPLKYQAASRTRRSWKSPIACFESVLSRSSGLMEWVPPPDTASMCQSVGF